MLPLLPHGPSHRSSGLFLSGPHPQRNPLPNHSPPGPLNAVPAMAPSLPPPSPLTTLRPHPQRPTLSKNPCTARPRRCPPAPRSTAECVCWRPASSSSSRSRPRAQGGRPARACTCRCTWTQASSTCRPSSSLLCSRCAGMGAGYGLGTCSVGTNVRRGAQAPTGRCGDMSIWWYRSGHGGLATMCWSLASPKLGQACAPTCRLHVALAC